MTGAVATTAPPRVVHVPKLAVSRRPRKVPERHDPDWEYRFLYLDKCHETLPHVVKFSGGRSSGMLLFSLLENGLLDAARGDVIVFNNTSCEHPLTYDFVRECRDVSACHGIPFFWVEFQTYEDARKGEWTRLPAYRLVKDVPWSPEEPDGFHWKGEVFEELLSWSGFVPNQFRRICTANMKIEATRLFLQDWFACGEEIPRLGHFGERPRADGNAMHARHLRNRGAVPPEVFRKKKAYVLGRPHVRPAQRYEDFSPTWQPVSGEAHEGKALGGKVVLGEGGAEYVALVGLRADEPLRVGRVRERNAGSEAGEHAGEHVYMPLADMRVGKDDVNEFWDRQGWDLGLPRAGSLSNCVYCFLKGTSNLRDVHQRMEREKEGQAPPGFGPLAGTPCDVAWWRRMEATYGRDMKAEGRETRSEIDFLGFFGTKSGFSYKMLAEADAAALEGFSGEVLPCECTE